MAFVAIVATLLGTGPAADAATDNLCNSPEFRRIYRADFNRRSDLDGWTIYNNQPGHGGNGRRSASAVTTRHGKLVITAQDVNGQTVSGGLSRRSLSQAYGCYRFRVRTDQDHANATSAVVMTWPTWTGQNQGGENDIYETTHRFARRRPFMSFIHRPGDHTNTSNDQHWYRHLAQADRYQTMTMVWTPNRMVIRREGPDVNGRYTVDEHTVPAANIPSVAHHPAIQLDARNGNRLTAPVRLEMDWYEVYDFTG